MISLTDEQRSALEATGGLPLTIRDEQSNTVYVLVDAQTHERAMEALERESALASIRRGISQMEAGLGRPAAEAEAELRTKHGLPPRS